MILENEVLKIEILPELGGKIISFFCREKAFELAAQTNRRIEDLPKVSDGFGPYAFGMDDAFPNIDAEQIEWKGRRISYPDHGEIWKAKFDVQDRTSDSVMLRWKSPMGYQYQKAYHLAGNCLTIRYQITNDSENELPCLWTWHGLMRYEADMEVILPEGTTHCRNVLSGPELGEAGTVYPITGVYDFSKVPNPESKSMSKFYSEHPVRSGRCGLRYPTQGMTCMLTYDPKILPYYGFWITAGGFQGDFNCALEPTNGFYDSVSMARRNGKLPVLAAGDTMTFDMKITLE